MGKCYFYSMVVGESPVVQILLKHWVDIVD